MNGPFFFILLALSAITALAMIVVMIRGEQPYFNKRSRKYDSHTGLPTTISADELGIIEGSIVNLKQIILIADQVEAPEGILRKAVEKNFSRGVRYTFIISQKNYDKELIGYYKIFETLAQISMPDTPMEKLIHIRELSYNWEEYPYIFYRSNRANDSTSLQTFGYRGAQRKEGIADDYVLLKPEIAHTIARLAVAAILRESIFPPIELEEFIGDPTTKITLDDIEQSPFISSLKASEYHDKKGKY